MAHFAYSGRDAGGGLVEGVLEGADSGSVAAALAGSGITPVRIQPAPAAPSSPASSSLLKAGVPILRALG